MAVIACVLWPSGRVVDQSDCSIENTYFLTIARLACEQETFDNMEKAIVAYSEKFNIQFDRFKIIKEYPLSGKYPMMTHVYTGVEEDLIIAAKGAPEGMLNQSGLSKSEIDNAHLILNQFAEKGYRVIAVATVENYLLDALPECQADFKLKLLGFIAFSDPIKETIPETLKSFRAAGIDVKMITGDHPHTAINIAKMAGFPSPITVMTGEQLNGLDKHELVRMVRNTTVFARAMPDTKLKIIEALKLAGEVVAMTGDGVNDGPALKAAHIGIAMGHRGSEVARQASSLVLLNNDLQGMVEAIATGRKIYSNLKKAIRYIISIHIPILAIVIIPLLLSWKYATLFSPVHIIFLELIMGPTCSLVFENEPVEPGIMNRTPRKFSVTFFNWRELSFSLLQGMIIAMAILAITYYYIYLGAEEKFVRTITFCSLVFSNVFLTISGRSTELKFWQIKSYRNKLVRRVILITLSFLFTAIFWSPVRSVFLFSTISPGVLATCVVVAALAVFWREILKTSS